MATLNFNANEVEPSVGFEPLPAGKYQAIIVDSEMKATKAGNGQYLQLELEVIDGELKGRKVWDRLNLDNPNSQAVEIARATLSAICRSVKVMEPKDSIDLHNLPLTITVACKKLDSGEFSNDIKGYAEKQSASAATSAAKADDAPPWKRK